MNGISGVMGAIALLGFLLFLGGVGLIVTSLSQGRPLRGGLILSIFGLIVGLAFTVMGSGILIVQPDQVAVIFQTLSGELQEPRRAGTHIIVPVAQAATLYTIETQQYTMSGFNNEGDISGDDAIRARTIDGQEVFIDLTVLYRIDPLQVNLVHQNWQNRYESDFIRPVLQGFVPDVVSRFRAEAVFGASRTEIQDAIETLARDRFSQEGFELDDLIIRNVTFSDEFVNSIERVQIAEQEAREAEFRVQQEEQEAETVRVRANGARDAEIARAEGDAQGIILRAQAQAEALSLVSEQIAANPSLLQYEYIQNLSDNVRLILIPSNSPYLFDMQSLANPNGEFSVPEFTPTETPTP